MLIAVLAIERSRRVLLSGYEPRASLGFDALEWTVASEGKQASSCGNENLGRRSVRTNLAGALHPPPHGITNPWGHIVPAEPPVSAGAGGPSAELPRG